MDPAVVLHLMDKEQMTTAEVNDLCNKKSGFKGISGVSNDLRELLAKAAEGHAAASSPSTCSVTGSRSI